MTLYAGLARERKKRLLRQRVVLAFSSPLTLSAAQGGATWRCCFAMYNKPPLLLNMSCGGEKKCMHSDCYTHIQTQYRQLPGLCGCLCLFVSKNMRTLLLWGRTCSDLLRTCAAHQNKVRGIFSGDENAVLRRLGAAPSACCDLAVAGGSEEQETSRGMASMVEAACAARLPSATCHISAPAARLTLRLLFFVPLALFTPAF